MSEANIEHPLDARRRVPKLWLAVACCVVAVWTAVAMAGDGDPGTSSFHRLEVRSLETQKVEIRDPRGKGWMRLVIEEGEPRITMFDEHDRERARYGLDSIEFRDREGHRVVRFGLMGPAGGGALYLGAHAGTGNERETGAGISLEAGPGDTYRIAASCGGGVAGFQIAGMGASAVAEPAVANVSMQLGDPKLGEEQFSVTIDPSDGARIRLADPKGRTIWEAPPR